jgi:hypothetical protein
MCAGIQPALPLGAHPDILLVRRAEGEQQDRRAQTMPEIMHRIADAAQLAVAWRLFDSCLDHFGADSLLERLWSHLF